MNFLFGSLLLALHIASMHSLRSEVANRIVNHVNSLQNVSWQAGPSRFDKWSLEQVTYSLGVTVAHIKAKQKIAEEKRLQAGRRQGNLFSYDVGEPLPENFDPRDKWPYCNILLNEIRDQGSCGSCWAFGAVEAMSDRICIATRGKLKPHLSAQDLVACCTSCGFGCFGGIPTMAWDYWNISGLVTGGNYNSNEGCIPYSVPSCDHHANGSLPPCGDIVSTPKCQKRCISGYGKSYDEDKYFGRGPADTSCLEEEIMKELYKNGPVEAALLVYEDFLNYKSGVYHHVTGNLGGGHAVKLLGWGVTPEGEKYWLAANSWNSDWGEKGFFRIRRGTDECGFESDIVYSLPEVNITDDWTVSSGISSCQWVFVAQQQFVNHLNSLSLTIVATVLSLIILMLVVRQRKMFGRPRATKGGYQLFK